MTKVGILGSGDVGKSLSLGFLKHGYDVMLGTEHKDKLDGWLKGSGFKGKVGDFKESAGFGDIIVLAVKGTAAKDVIKTVKSEIMHKTIIDATNPISDKPPENGVLRFFTSHDSSLMEELQKAAPDANFVKAFNSIGSAFMVNPGFKDKPTMFICGNDKTSKRQVEQIIDKFGFISEDMGQVESARAIEPLCILWCIPGFMNDDWAHAFKFLKM